MSKSLNWVKDRAGNPEVSRIADRDWSKAIEYNSKTVFDRIPIVKDCGYTIQISTGEESSNRVIHLSFEPESEKFEYFTTEVLTTDGTLYFQKLALENIAERVCCLQTVNNTKVKTWEDFKEIYWTIGNFALIEEFGSKFAPSDKPWMQSRITAILPLRMDVV